MAEFKPWLGHVPRDRGSIWYLAPLMTIGFPLVLAVFLVLLVVGGA